ncbi:MAG TPA: cytochrome c [Bryobacteraceae bacterium]|nr:cytochrome c [Bryobacteraceae bacterium]
MRTGIVYLLLASAALAQDAPGKQLFEKKCGTCHASTTDERRIGPSLKGLKAGVMPDAIGKEATRENILKQINDGGGGMPVFRELLTKEEKDAIVAYVMTL